MPTVWRYVPFEAVLRLANMFKAQPLTDNPDGGQALMFNRNVEGKDAGSERKFIDWRKAFLMLSLMSGKIPTREQKDAYFNLLRNKKTACQDAKLTKEVFIKVSS